MKLLKNNCKACHWRLNVVCWSLPSSRCNQSQKSHRSSTKAREVLLYRGSADNKGMTIITWRKWKVWETVDRATARLRHGLLVAMVVVGWTRHSSFRRSRYAWVQGREKHQVVRASNCGLAESPACPLCLGEASLQHILNCCPKALGKERCTWHHDQVLKTVLPFVPDSTCGVLHVYLGETSGGTKCWWGY